MSEIQTIETTNDSEMLEFNPQALATLPGISLPDTATPQERRAMASVVSRFLGASTSMEDCYNKTVEVAGAMIHPVRLTDVNSGEVIDKMRIVWLLTTGECLSSVSMVTKQYTEMVLLPFFNHGNMGLFEFSAKVAISAQKTRAGRKTFSFALIEE